MIMTTAAVSQDVSKHPECGSFHMMVACLRLLETAACGFLDFQKNCHFNIYEPPLFNNKSCYTHYRICTLPLKFSTI